MTELRLLLKLIDEAFDRRAWHGPNLRGSLRNVTAAQAARRPGRGRHNIWEIAVHAAYWKYTVRRRLTGLKRGSFALPGSNWFTRPQAARDEKAWKADLALLTAEHRALREAVKALRVDDLFVPAAGSRQTYASLLCGIASHDIYHAGQIQLLKRMVGRRP